MTLRRRTLAYLALLLVGMTAILYISLQRITISSFETVEHAQTVRQASSLHQYMLNRQDELFNKVRDWSSWTEMTDFVAGGGTDKAFIGDNLREVDLETNGISFMLMLDLQGDEVHWLSRIDNQPSTMLYGGR
ncbi:MAG: hypothetical protein IPK19_18655 [Chloroflexi bacterium]|nr:hypothetical protein [Chloroflexota bacterium]